MFCRTVGVIAAVTLGANAFLLPFGAKPIEGSRADIARPNENTISLPCSDCLFNLKDGQDKVETEENDDIFWIQGGAQDVILDFKVSEDEKALEVNGWQLYPVTLDNDDVATASISNSNEKDASVTPLEVSGASISVNEQTITSDGDKVVTIRYHIFALHNQVISVDATEVQLLEGVDGSLMILSVEPVDESKDIFGSLFPPSVGDEPPAKDLPPPPPRPFHHHHDEKHGEKHEGEEDCKMLPAALCKWKGMFASKIESLKNGFGHPHKAGGCHKAPHKLPGHVKPHFETSDGKNEEGPQEEQGPQDGERPKHHHGYPHPHGMHKGPHHHGHHGHGHLIHRFVRAFLSVLVPVMAGMTLGLCVGLVGMLTGRLISFLWIKFRRGGQRGYISLSQASDETASVEKAMIVEAAEEKEYLPSYEDAPAYSEKEQQ